MFGHVIDSQSGYLPNKMELGGRWNAHFEAYENTGIGLTSNISFSIETKTMICRGPCCRALL